LGQYTRYPRSLKCIEIVCEEVAAEDERAQVDFIRRGMNDALPFYTDQNFILAAR
jgi:hypothetical protein